MGKARSTKPLKRVVLDASILVKLVLPETSEQNVKQALALFKRFTEGGLEIVLPVFWSFEVGNVLLRKLSEELFEEKFRFLLQQPFHVYAFNEVESITVGKFAKLYDVSFYDASYHLLAYFTNCVFITADRKYLQKFKGDTYVVLLQDLKMV